MPEFAESAEPAGPAKAQDPQAGAEHWRRTRRLTLVLLTVWAIAGFGLVYFARELNRVEFLGAPLGFWIASQGAVLVFLAIVIVFAVLMNRDGSRR